MLVILGGIGVAYKQFIHPHEGNARKYIVSKTAGTYEKSEGCRANIDYQCNSESGKYYLHCIWYFYLKKDPVFRHSDSPGRIDNPGWN